MAIYTLEIPGWMPTPLNKLMGHWGTRSKNKAKDRSQISMALKVYNVSKATGKRKVSIIVILPKGKRACDPDALHKSLLDGLVQGGGLVNDSKDWVAFTQPLFARGEYLCTYITLQDIG